jgi:uncharacterized membrane protein (DUF441 family)
MTKYRRQDYFADRTLARYGAPLDLTERTRTAFRAVVLGTLIAGCIFYGAACAVLIVAGLN